MHYILDDCKFLPDWTTDNGVSCSSVSKIYHYRLICNWENGVSSFSRLFFLLAGSQVSDHYAPYFEKVDGAYCFWSVPGWVRACVGGCVRAWVTLFVPTVNFKPLKLES